MDDSIIDQDVLSRVFSYIEHKIIKQFPSRECPPCVLSFHFFKIVKIFIFTDGSEDLEAITAIGCLLNCPHIQNECFESKCRILFQQNGKKREIGINSYSRICKNAQSEIRTHYKKNILKEVEDVIINEDTATETKFGDEDEEIPLFGARKDAASMGPKSIKNLAAAISYQLIDVMRNVLAPNPKSEPIDYLKIVVDYMASTKESRKLTKLEKKDEHNKRKAADPLYQTQKKLI